MSHSVLIGVALSPGPVFGWGWHVHSLVNRAATASLPADFVGFTQWADSLASLASAADARRCCDDNEGPRHYIDIDAYAEFFTGTLPRTYDAMVAGYGRERVIGNGIVPWAIETALDELTGYFRARNWPRAVEVAADIGHYVADSHQPPASDDQLRRSRDGSAGHPQPLRIDDDGNLLFQGDRRHHRAEAAPAWLPGTDGTAAR